MVIWKKCCCCSILKACTLIGVLGAFGCIFRIKSDVAEIMEDKMSQDTREEKINGIMAVMEELNIYVNREGAAKFIDLSVSTAYVDLVVNAFGLIVFCLLLFGAQKRSEKLLIPALVFIPIDFLKCTVFLILFAIPFGFSNPLAITLIVINLLNALIYIPEWIAIYSLRQELLGDNNAAGDYELAQQQKV